MAEKAKSKGEKSSPSKGNNNTLAYILMWITAPLAGLAYMKDEDELVAYNAKQSVYYGLVSLGLYTVFFVLMYAVVGLCLFPLWCLIDFGVKIFMIVKGSQGERYELPLVGEWAKK